ncbi:MAG: DUF1772 domain-containing protein [Pleurocapsa sp. SU_196_0]|nr:DUF1772 domain-containing protein [Pleurocapsa sp. SU_196_0]
MDWLFLLTLGAALGSGLIAGVFFAFSSFVMQSLQRLPAPQSITAMNTINVVIINSLFMVAFLGTAVLCAALVVVSALRWGQPGSSLSLLGAALYLVGNIFVTGAFNIPLNNALARVTPEGSTLEAWRQYFAPWMLWNHVRTGTALTALGAFVLALTGR